MTSTSKTPLASEFAPAGDGKTYCWSCSKSFETGKMATLEWSRRIAEHEQTKEHRESKAARGKKDGVVDG